MCKIHHVTKSFPRGNIRAPILIISDKASDPEEKKSFPLMNTRGYFLIRKALKDSGVQVKNVLYANAINCYPCNGSIEKTRLPSRQEVLNCKRYLNTLLKISEPKLIVLLGPVAFNAFHKGAIAAKRGTWIEVMNIPTMPTYHPEYFTRMMGLKSLEIIKELERLFFSDLKKAFDYYKKER